jgi:hypothetical protein
LGRGRQEKDVTQRAKDLLRQIIHTVVVDGFTVTDIKKISGEATLINRKKKQSVLYEMSGTLAWKGCYLSILQAATHPLNITGEFFGTPLSGEIVLVEIADELSENELEASAKGAHC